MEYMYANKFTVTVSENEVILRFGWIAPSYNENDDVVGNQVVSEQNIVLSRAAYEGLRHLMNELNGEKSVNE